MKQRGKDPEENCDSYPHRFSRYPIHPPDCMDETATEEKRKPCDSRKRFERQQSQGFPVDFVSVSHTISLLRR